MLTYEVLSALIQLFGDKVSVASQDIMQHSHNLYYINQYQPDAVVFAEQAADVMNLVDFCIKHQVPLIPYGSGTSTEGHTAARYGGICLNLQKMNKVIGFNLQDQTITVEPGISYNQVNDFLSDYGFYFPVEAGMGASIGGMVATNASGAGATDSGSMAKNLSQCEVVIYQEGKAKLIKTGSRALKSSAGYQLSSFFVGSEGTLGVVVKATLRLRKKNLCTETICLQFDSIHTAIQLIIGLKGTVNFKRAELLDAQQTEACIQYSKILYLNRNKHTLLIELGGNPQAVVEEIALIHEALNELPHEKIDLSDDNNRQDELWLMRKNAAPAVVAFRDHNKKAVNTDICVPLSALIHCIDFAYHHAAKAELYAPLVAHIADGNFHFTLVVNPADNHEMQQAKLFHDKIVTEAIACGGTCTGEHGIGMGKIEYLIQEHESSVHLMKLLKRTMDPIGIFNPGKIISHHATNITHLHWLLRYWQSYGAKEALIYNDRSYTYNDLIQSVENWLLILEKNTIRKGEIVAVCGDYSPQLCGLLFALLINKNIVIPIAFSSFHNKQAFIEIGQANYCIELSDMETPVIHHLSVTPSHPLLIEYLKQDLPGIILFSSGSTGKSKGMLLNAELLLSKFQQQTKSYRTLVFLLFDHIGGINTLFHVLSQGGTLIIVPKRDPAIVCELIEKCQAELLPTTPTFLNMLLISGLHERYDLSSLKLITYGAEPMPLTTLKQMNKQLPKVSFKQTYGLSEVGILSTKSEGIDSPWFQLSKDINYKIIDDSLWIKTRAQMVGYLNAENPFDEQGWFNTGDMVLTKRVGDAEYIRILGRKSEIINVGGEKVFPAEVENILIQVPNIMDAVINGKQNPITGQVVVAKVSLAQPEDPQQLNVRIRQFCQNKLEAYKIPVYVEIVNQPLYGERYKKNRRSHVG